MHKLLRAAATCACLELACTHADTAQTTHNQVSAIYEPQASVHRKKEKANARTGQANSASSEKAAVYTRVHSVCCSPCPGRAVHGHTR